MKDVYQVKSFELAVKDVDMGARTVVQAFTRYNVKDSDGDIGRRGMFVKTWAENKSRIKHLLNHDTTKPIGKVEDLWDDEEYAYGKSKIGVHTLGDDFIKMADSGLITEASYGYQVVKENVTDAGNELLEVKQWEFSSLTCWGANQYTPIISLTKSASKLEQENKIAARVKALEKFCKDTTASDDTIQLLLLEIKQLQQLYIDLNKTATVPTFDHTADSKNDLNIDELKGLITTSLNFKS